MFYVYEWFIVETGEIIYVGKGTKNRYKVTKHNRFFNDMIKRYKCNSRILKEFEKEKDAFEYEYDRVNELWSKGQCVCNIYRGGTGGTTSWWDENRKEWYSVHNTMKSEEHRKRMSKQNPMKIQEVKLKVKTSKQRKVIIGNKEFQSVKDVVLTYNVAFQTVKKWCDKGTNPYGEQCRYQDSEQVEFKDKRYNKGSCRPLIYKGKFYESPIDLAKVLKLRNSTICVWAKRGFDPEGNECKYVDDTENHYFKKWVNGESIKKAIWVNGILYDSKSDAEKQLGLSKGYLAPYIAGIRKNKKYICVYDNQQPSQTNTDNSSLEGSTTNG